MEKTTMNKDKSTSKRSLERLDSATSAAFFKFAYTHRKFKIDCDSGQVVLEGVYTAVKKLEDDVKGILSISGLLDGVFLTMPDRGELARYIAAMVQKYHNEYVAGPEYKFEDGRLQDIESEIEKTVRYLKNEVSLLHGIAHTYGYFVHALLEEVIPAEHMLSIYQSQRQKPYLEPPETFFIKSYQNKDVFHIHFKNRNGENNFEDKRSGFLYVYVDILKRKPTFRQIVDDVTTRVMYCNFEDYGERDSANLQMCIDLSKIDGASTKWMAIFKRRLLRQIEKYYNYLYPNQLSLTQQNEIVSEVDGIPNEQMGDINRITGLWLWDEVQAVCPTHLRRGQMPEKILTDAMKKIEAKIDWRRADGRGRNLHADYLLADECIKRMDVLNGVSRNQKISDHFAFANRKNK